MYVLFVRIQCMFVSARDLPYFSFPYFITSLLFLARPFSFYAMCCREDERTGGEKVRVLHLGQQSSVTIRDTINVNAY